MSTSGDGKYKKNPKTTANNALRWRAVIMAGCMLPIGVYIVGTAGTDALDAYYVLATAVPPFVASAYYLAKYTTHCRFARPSQRLLNDSECYAVTKFQQACPMWLWGWSLATPMAEIVSLTAFVFITAHVPGHTAAAIRFHWFFNWFAWFLVHTCGVLAICFNFSSQNKQRWEAEKAVLELAHQGAADSMEAIERYAVRRADAVTVGSAGLKAITNFLCLCWSISVCASQLDMLAAVGAGPQVVFMIVDIVVLYPTAWTIFNACIVVFPSQYFINFYVCEALVLSTNEQKAAAEGLPHLPLDTCSHIWQWFEMRQLFVTDRFDMVYGLVAPVVSFATLAIMGYTAFVLILVFAFRAPIFQSLEYQVFVVIGLSLIVTLMYLLSAVARVYPGQQSHLYVLRRASAAATAAAGADSGRAAALADKLVDIIADEQASPHVFSIPVKPTFFYVVIGYVGTTVIALVANAMAIHVG